MSQTEIVLKHMQDNNGISQIEALLTYGIYRLAARVNDLRNDGVDIGTYKGVTNTGKIIGYYKLRNK